MAWLWPNGATRRPYIPAATGYYGPRDPIVTPGGTTGAFHTGLDFTGFATVRSVGPGIVVYAAKNTDYGNEVRVRHQAAGFISRYAHLADGSLRVKVGDSVDGGTPLGVMGATGKAKGVHLHMRFDRLTGGHFDPLSILPGLVTGGGSGGGSIPEEDDLTPDQANKLEAIYAAVWNGGSNTVDGVPMKYNYGILHMAVANQELITRVIRENAALSAAVAALKPGTGSVDLEAVKAAARAGAEQALQGIRFPTAAENGKAARDAIVKP